MRYGLQQRNGHVNGGNSPNSRTYRATYSLTPTTPSACFRFSVFGDTRPDESGPKGTAMVARTRYTTRARGARMARSNNNCPGRRWTSE
jgi:hypothetical protein